MNKPVLEKIARHTFSTLYGNNAEICNIQETFYGFVVFLVSGNTKAVIKFSKEMGRIQKEVAHLETLRHKVSCPVPAIHFFGREEGYDYIVLEWMNGVSAHELPHTPEAIAVFKQDYTKILLELHDATHPKGYELARGDYTNNLTMAFDEWMKGVFRYLMCSASPFSARLKDKYTQLWENRHHILAPIADQPSSFVHDDCHLANVLFDPKTYKVSALLDPCDSGFKHRELDIFHCYDVRPDIEIAEHYMAQRPLTEGFEARRHFFSLWDDAKHSRNMGWYQESWLLNKFQKWEQASALL